MIIFCGWLKNLPRLAGKSAMAGGKIATAGGKICCGSGENPLRLAEKSATAGGKICYGWRKKITPPTVEQSAMFSGKNPPWLAEKSSMFAGNSRSGVKFCSLVCNNFPRKFHRRQVVVLRHAISDLELSGIPFAVVPFQQFLYHLL
jgi:hypothetical protein